MAVVLGDAVAVPEDVPLWGGRLCLDFANTTAWDDDDRPLANPDEVLRTPADLLTWGRRLDLVDDAAPPQVLDDDLALRGAVHGVFAALARGRRPVATEVRTLEERHALAVRRGELDLAGGTGRFRWPRDDATAVGDAVAVDAVGLLTDGSLVGRVRRCPGPGCGWLFLDRSGRRRWCSMQVCGSRVKMRRLAERQRQL